jgi:hypothetical protein
MATTSTTALLAAWEHGRDASPGERGLLLLGVAHPEVPPSRLSDWSVGQRDAALLALSERLFGARLPAQAHCPRCAALLQFEVDVPRIAAAAPPTIAAAFVFSSDGFRVTYRLPNAGDLAALGCRTGGRDDDASLNRWLLDRCIVAVEPGDARDADRGADRPRAAAEPEHDAATGPSVAVAATRPIRLPSDVAAALESEMTATITAADPLAQIELELACPACAAAWTAPFDIVRFLWSEVEAWAMRILDEVHVLASRYGWSETEILALSPQRRQHYRELIGT